MSHFQKQRAQVDDYAVDFVDELDGDTIVSATLKVYEVMPGGDRVDRSTQFDSNIVATISGSVVVHRLKAAGATDQKAEYSPGYPVRYEIVVTCTTNLGREIPSVSELRVYRAGGPDAT